jgi:hypothetical protein
VLNPALFPLGFDYASGGCRACGHDPYAAEVFAKNCASCNQSEAGARGRIPQIDVLKSMTSAAIPKTLDSGHESASRAALGR